MNGSTIDASTDAQDHTAIQSRNSFKFASHRRFTSRQCALFHPVDVEQALRKQPRAVLLHESIEVAERGNHQASLVTVHGNVMRKAVGFAGASSLVKREDCALSNEVRGRGILGQLCEDWSKRLA